VQDSGFILYLPDNGRDLLFVEIKELFYFADEEQESVYPD